MKTLAPLGLAVLIATGCTYTVYSPEPTTYVAPDYVVVGSAPPPVQVAVAQPPQPQSDAFWVAGHWSWQGRWVWTAGQWQIPQPGNVWQEPVVVRVGTSYRYYPGYWHRHTQQPAPAYRQPGTIRVAVQRPPTQTVQVRQPSQTVTVQQPNQRPSATVTVQPPPNQRPGATVTVQPPPNQRPGVVVQPGTVRPTAPNTQRPGVVVQPGTVRPTAPNTQRPGAIQQQPLSCRVMSSTVPRGGLLTITGSGLAGASVRIGGMLSPVESSSDRAIQARAAGGGGAVTVTVGGQNANCGSVRVMAGR